jgi:cytochrome c biogenesis protein CcdA
VPRYWIRYTCLYTVAGSASAAMVGAGLGVIGGAIGLGSHKETVFWGISALASVLAAREMGWLSFPIPESRRQTEQRWAHEAGFLVASTMWGFHIGLGFATRMKYGGFWLLVLLAITFGSASYGAILMLAYWAGRALPVWLVPLFDKFGRNETEIPSCQNSLYRRIDAIVLSWSAIIAFLIPFHLGAISR